MANWKTTFVGCALAVLNYWHSVGAALPSTKNDWFAFAVSTLLAAFGFVAKDVNVTGGNKSNDTAIKL